MEADKRLTRLKEEIVEIYANECMDTLRKLGVQVGDGGRFYDQLFELIENSILFGDIR